VEASDVRKAKIHLLSDGCMEGCAMDVI
jgi:hypothetical protein